MANAKSGSTRVATSKLVKTAEQCGLTLVGRAGWILMYKEGTPSRRLLVHTGKRGTNCIELVGFEVEYDGVVAHPCPPAKTMTQMLDMNITEPEILRNFFKTARLLAPAPVAPAKEEPASSPAEAPAQEVATQA